MSVASMVVCRLKQGGRQPSRGDPADLAVKALSFIAADRGRLGRFLDATGVEPEAIRAAAQMPSFLPGVLDYILDDEGLVIGFSRHAQVEPQAIWDALNALTPGFDGI